MSDQPRLVDHHGALEHLRAFARSHGIDPRLDLAEIVIAAFRSVHGRTGHAGDRVPLHQLETAAVVAWSHVEDVRSEVPCPEWCELEAGHAYMDEDDTGNLVRDHSRVFGEGPAQVQLSQFETSLGPTGPVALEPVEARLMIGGDLTSSTLDARSCAALAAALTAAGRDLERLTNQAQTSDFDQ